MWVPWGWGTIFYFSPGSLKPGTVLSPEKKIYIFVLNWMELISPPLPSPCWRTYHQSAGIFWWFLNWSNVSNILNTFYTLCPECSSSNKGWIMPWFSPQNPQCLSIVYKSSLRCLLNLIIKRRALNATFLSTKFNTTFSSPGPKLPFRLICISADTSPFLPSRGFHA